jgi:hypothetical protein
MAHTAQQLFEKKFQGIKPSSPSKKWCDPLNNVSILLEELVLEITTQAHI